MDLESSERWPGQSWLALLFTSVETTETLQFTGSKEMERRHVLLERPLDLVPHQVFPAGLWPPKRSPGACAG